MRRPFDGLGAGSPQHPFADFVDQPDFLGQRDEQGGADRAMFRMVPANQSFETDRLFARSIDLGLVDDPELSLLKRHAQVGF